MKSKLDKREYRDLIYKLKTERKTYGEITEYFNSIGIETSVSAVRKICIDEFNIRKEEIPSAREKVYDNIDDDELIRLKESGMSVREMEEHYKDKGVEINSYQIRKRLLRIYNSKGERIPRAEAKHKNTTVSNNEIQVLTEEGLSSIEISRIISAQTGKSISPSGVGYRQEEIYDDNGIKRPKVISKSRIKLPEEEVCELRKENYSYEAISIIMKEKYGIEIAAGTVRTKCKKFFLARGEEEPKIGKKDLKGIEDFYEQQESISKLERKEQELLDKKKKSLETLAGFKKLEKRLEREEIALR